jgi:hypothetical protein
MNVPFSSLNVPFSSLKDECPFSSPVAPGATLNLRKPVMLRRSGAPLRSAAGSFVAVRANVG